MTMADKKWLAKEARFLSLYFPLFPCRLYTVFNLAFGIALLRVVWLDDTLALG